MHEERKPEITVVVPAFNEAAVIAVTLRDILGYLKKHFTAFEIIVVDDGSRDATVSEAASVAGVTVLRNEQNRGKGFSVRRGVLASSGALILFMDADNSTNISELNHFLLEIRDADIVIGSRALSGSVVEVSQNIIKRLLGRVGNRMIRILLGLRLKDTRCGFKLFKEHVKPVFEKQKIEGWSFDDEILFLANQAGLKIVESPVVWVNNFDSKVSPLVYLTTVGHLLGIRWRYHRGKYNS